MNFDELMQIGLNLKARVLKLERSGRVLIGFGGACLPSSLAREEKRIESEGITIKKKKEKWS